MALDQLAREILRHLKDHKLTVVWLFDESVSMQDDQRTILEKFDRVSSELKKNIEPGKKSAGALNHAIVGFGQGIDYVLKKPTLDIDEIGRAIKQAADRHVGHREHHARHPRDRRRLRRADRQGPQDAPGAGDRRVGRRRGRRRGGPPGAEEVQGAALRHRPPVALRLPVRPPPLRRPGDQGRLPPADPPRARRPPTSRSTSGTACTTAGTSSPRGSPPGSWPG